MPPQGERKNITLVPGTREALPGMPTVGDELGIGFVVCPEAIRIADTVAASPSATANTRGCTCFMVRSFVHTP